MRALITGSTGFVGSYLLQQLLQENNFETIVCLTRNPSKLEFLKSNPKIEVIEGNITDKTSLNSKFENIDLIYHLA